MPCLLINGISFLICHPIWHKAGSGAARPGSVRGGQECPFWKDMDLEPLKPITETQLEGAAVAHLLKETP